MNKHKHIIVINGRDYNAKTGEALSKPVKAAAPPHVAAKQPGAVKPRPAASRQSAAHIRPHAPKPARTLMRQAVKKPSPSLKRHIKVQGHLGVTAAPAHRQPKSQAAHSRQHPAKTRNGQLISHFSPDLFTNVTHITVKTERPAPVKRAGSPAAVRPTIAVRKPRTTAELLDYAIQHADVPEPLPVRKTHRRLFKRHAHAAAH